MILHALRRSVAPAGAAAAVLAVLGPFGTFGDLSFGIRLLYWVIIVGLSTVQMVILLRLVERWLPAPRWPEPVATAAASLIAAVPTTLEVWGLEAVFRPASLANIALSQVYLLALLVILVMTGVFQLLLRAKPTAAAPAALAETPNTAESQPGAPAFLRRIPPRLGDDLLCLRTEDHYLRIYTPLGDDLILFRLRDALDELAGLRGLQVHRSWWVAEHAVAGVERDNGKTALRLSNGLNVPVSRTFLPALKTAGWRDFA